MKGDKEAFIIQNPSQAPSKQHAMSLQDVYIELRMGWQPWKIFSWCKNLPSIFTKEDYNNVFHLLLSPLLNIVKLLFGASIISYKVYTLQYRILPSKCMITKKQSQSLILFCDKTKPFQEPVEKKGDKTYICTVYTPVNILQKSWCMLRIYSFISPQNKHYFDKLLQRQLDKMENLISRMDQKWNIHLWRCVT